MTNDSTTECLLFPEIFSKPVVAQFDEQQGSSDGGSGEIALSTVLLMAAGLFAWTLFQLRSINAGYSTTHLVTFSVDVSALGKKGWTGAQRILRDEQ